MAELTVRQADFDDPRDADAVLQMTRAYALDPIGGGQDLTDEVQSKLIDQMRAHPALVSFVAREGDSPVGVANCVMSFSTFRARRVLNIHDFAVIGEARGRGVGRRMMDALEQYARARDCVAITLEVFSKNQRARDMYHAMGFTNARKTKEEDSTIFCCKEL